VSKSSRPPADRRANVSPSNDVLHEERNVLLAAVLAAIGATLDADDLSHDPLFRSDGRLLTAARQKAELLVQCLSAQDRFIQCCSEIGSDSGSIAALREGRAELALRLQQTLADVEQLSSDTEQQPPP